MKRRLPAELRPSRRHTEPREAEVPAGEVNSEPADRISKRRIVAGAIIVLLLGAAYWGLSQAGLIPDLGDEARLRAQVEQWGAWGPLLLTLLMAAAIVFSPVPSGPIAVVAGAAYGPILGTMLVVTGAVLGAVIAFWIARCLGYETLRCWPAARKLLQKLNDGRSQTRLMTIVFLSRLVPFISFDAVSYVAGLTPLAFWRFSIATLAGVVPVSFALAYFGDRIIAAETDRLMLLLLLAGSITALPVALRLLSRRRKQQGSAGLDKQR